MTKAAHSLIQQRYCSCIVGSGGIEELLDLGLSLWQYRSSSVCHFSLFCIIFPSYFRFVSDENTKFNESIVGKFVQSVPRDSVTVATKFHPMAHPFTAEGVQAAVNGSLERLGLEYIDLVFLSIFFNF